MDTTVPADTELKEKKEEVKTEDTTTSVWNVTEEDFDDLL